MRLTRIIMLFTILFTLVSCLKESDSICPPKNNVSLLFSLPDKGDTEVFAANISSVDVMVYDAMGVSVLTKRINQNELNIYQGVDFTLPAGTYSLVCWGNLNGKATINGVANSNTPNITYTQINAGKVASSDNIYYGASITTRATNIPSNYQIIVPEQGTYKGKATFKAAHRNVEIFIKGYTENSQNAFPNVELTGIPASLSLLDKTPLTSAGIVTYRSATQTVTVAGAPYATAAGQTFWFNIDNSITIKIYSPTTGELIYSTHLQDAIDPSADPTDVNIRVVLEFKNGNVEILFPNWNSGDIGWGPGI